jgi:hypothetical protein
MRLDTPINVADLPVATGDYSLIPDGVYPAVIKAATIENTKAGTGQYVKIRFDIMGANHAGRVVFTNLNIRNPNPKAEEIGRQQLGELARALGIATVTDTDQLVGGQCQIKITTRKSEQYGDQNEVKSFKAMEGSKPPAPTVTVSGGETSAPPWAKPAF